MAKWLESLKSEDPGFNPLEGEGEERFFCPSESTLAQICLCLTTPSCAWVRTHICAHVKDLIFICRKKSRPHSRWYGNTKTLHKENSWVALYVLWKTARESSPNFPCIVLGQESYSCNLIKPDNAKKQPT